LVDLSPKRGECSPPSAQTRDTPLVQVRKPQIENSLQGKILRRCTFFYRFMLARTHSEAILKFEPLLAQFFEHEWLAGVSVRFRFLPGPEDREITIPWPRNKYLLQLRLLPWREQGCRANWSAPVTVIVSKKVHDGEPKPVRYMSLFIQGDVIHIAQLQGAHLIEMPKGLRDWAVRFVRACMEFARQENFRGVRLARADSLYSYHNPSLHWYPTPEQRARALKQIRQSIETHHDETAQTLGLTSEKDWFWWKNPDFRPL
jgi:hypothetical protein